MRHLIRPLARRTAIAAVLVTIALALVPTAFGDPWGRDHADAVARQGLDPAIRTAIAARSTVPITARSTVPAPVAATIPRLSPADDGFAWGAATLGLVTGIAAMCAVLVCVSLVRHDGTASTRVIPEGGVRTSPRPDPWHADAPISIRPARARELREIAALFAPALEPYRGSGSDWILDAYLAELVDVRPRFEEAEVLVAEHHGRVVGTIAFYAGRSPRGLEQPPGRLGRISRARGAPRMRGAGIGKALVQHCIERTRNVGAETLGIHTISLLTDAVRLYQRLGFVRCPEFDLRAADVFPSENADEMVGLAFRRDVEPAAPPRL